MTKGEFKKKVREIIQKDFKGVRNPFVVFVSRQEDMFMATIKIPYVVYFLFVDEEVFQMNDKAIIGCLVHELNHMANWAFDEREIDQMVIDKGYGWDLYEFLKYHDNIYVRYNKEDGLTKKEVLRQLKQE